MRQWNDSLDLFVPVQDLLTGFFVCLFVCFLRLSKTFYFWLTLAFMLSVCMYVCTHIHTRHSVKGPVNVRMRKALLRCVILTSVTLFYPGQFISFLLEEDPDFFGVGE